MIIDIHTHIFPAVFREKRSSFFADEPAFEMLYSSPASRMAGADELSAVMEKDRVDISVVFGFPWKNPDHFRRNNDYIIESVNKYPGRITGFCCFDPVSPEGAKEAERCFKQGLKGVGELAVYDSPLTTDIIDRLYDVMTLSKEHDVPVLIHTNEPVGHQYPGKQEMTLKQIYNLVRTYPDNKIILAHWGGGILFYSLLKKEVKDALKNVWFDTAASPFLYSPDIYRTAGETAGYDKILFGSDYPLIKPERYFKEIDSAGIEPENIDKIKGENAALLIR